MVRWDEGARLLFAAAIVCALPAPPSSAADTGHKPAVAVLKLEAKGDIAPKIASVLDDYLSAEVFNTGRYDMVNRDRIESVMKEFKLQKSGLCDTTKCYAEIGGAMGAEKLLVGSVSRIGKTYLVNLKLIDITLIKEEFVASSPCDCEEDQLLAKVSELVGRMAGNPDFAANSPSTSPAGVPRQSPPGGIAAGATGDLPSGLRHEGNRLIRSKDGAEVVFVPAGAFQMGSTEADVDIAVELTWREGETQERSLFTDEMPRHEVRLSAFYVDRFEVTNELYAHFVKETGRQAPSSSIDPNQDVWTKGAYPPSLARHPVVNASWADAVAYCAWAGGRLPTEAE